MLLSKQFPEINFVIKWINPVFHRILIVIINEIIIFLIIVYSDLGETGGTGLIINFASAILISQLDDYLYENNQVKSLKEDFNNVVLTKEDHLHNNILRDIQRENQYSINNDEIIREKRFDNCGFLKVKISERH